MITLIKEEHDCRAKHELPHNYHNLSILWENGN